MNKLKPIILNERIKETFNSFVLYGMPDGCHYWIGGRYKDKYGIVAIRVKRPHPTLYMAHRVSYELYKGSTFGLVVCHACDNMLCVNPDHLFLGTQQDNIEDRQRKGRQARGETHYKSKLTAASVKVILDAYRHGYKIKDIANYFRVTLTSVRGIAYGQSWSHLKY